MLSPETGVRIPVAVPHETPRTAAGFRVSESAAMAFCVPKYEIPERVAAYEPPEPPYRAGVMAKYANSVSSASAGAVTE